MKKVIACVLAILLCLTNTQVETVEAKTRGTEKDVVYQQADETGGIAEQTIRAYEDTLLYSYTDGKFSFCSQMSIYGGLQFSYILSGSNDIIESPVYDTNAVYNRFNIEKRDDEAFVKINHAIMKNLESFLDCKTIQGDNTKSTGDSSLDQAVASVFGNNYTGTQKGMSYKPYNGTTYIVRCKESQTTSAPSISSKWFAKETAITSVVAWVISGNWTWMGLVNSIVLTVVTTIIVNGIRVIKNKTKGQRADVSIIRTRKVTVDGVSGTQYWAGWTRKVYFFKGDLGWAHDSDPHYEVKHDDYDSISTLLLKGWQNYLNGGY